MQFSDRYEQTHRNSSQRGPFYPCLGRGGSEIPNDPGRVVQYKVYYRVHGSYNWQFLMEVENSGSPECLVTSKDMDYGRYDFAVSAITEQQGVSALHSSLDRTADPFSGWYINWIGSK